MEFQGYTICDCGAYTFHTDEGDYCCKAENVSDFFPDINLEDIEQFQNTFCCDHCVNHFGLDLCGCGSGEEYGSCDNDLEACKIPMQCIGLYQRVCDPDPWRRKVR